MSKPVIFTISAAWDDEASVRSGPPGQWNSSTTALSFLAQRVSRLAPTMSCESLSLFY
jgi:hypothetical protein